MRFVSLLLKCLVVFAATLGDVHPEDLPQIQKIVPDTSNTAGSSRDEEERTPDQAKRMHDKACQVEEQAEEIARLLKEILEERKIRFSRQARR